MLGKDKRYDPVDAVWRSVHVPPITRAECIEAEKRLLRRFDRVEDRSPLGSPCRPYRGGNGRRCWINTRAGYDIQKGWARLVHDVSHRLFHHRHPSWRPHETSHAAIELAMAQWVVDCGWLVGAPLAPKKRTPPGPTEKLIALDERIERWQRKAKRATTALKKLNRQRKAMAKRIAP